MKKTNENYMNEIKEELKDNTLSIFCFDSVKIQAKVTFDSCLVQGVQATFWMEDDENIELQINSIFDILFEEVVKIRKKCKDKLK